MAELADLALTIYIPIALSFIIGYALFRLRHKYKMREAEIYKAREGGEFVASVVRVEDCRASKDKCNQRLESLRELNEIGNKEIHNRITTLSEEFFETRGALTEAVRATKEAVKASDQAAKEAQSAAAEARVVAGEARALVAEYKRANGGR